MKKLLFSFTALCMGMCAMAQSNVYVYEKDGETLELEMSNLDSISFTKPTKATKNGYTWVDLGLSVRWAACNVGAAKPEDYGSYYAWGEIATKTTYDWTTYKYANGSFSTLTKYCNKSNYGKDSFTDGLTTLTAADDAAIQTWGGVWRMPTDDEWQELIDNCDYNWTTDYNNTGKAGCVLTSKINGSSIFLPAAGYYDEGTLQSAGSYGGYWSSTLSTNDPNDAKSTGLHSGGISTGNYRRGFGRSVRPVSKAGEVIAPCYSISLAETENGTISTSATLAQAGETVTIKTTSNSCCNLKSLSVKCGENEVEVTSVSKQYSSPGTEVTENTFVMPAGEVKITASFELDPDC